MADRVFGTSAAPPAPSLGTGEWRIDSWTPSGWEELVGFFDRTSAETALGQLRQREPDTLFRVVHRLPPDAPEANAPKLGLAGERRRPVPVHDPPPESVIRSVARASGALGLVALVALACAARWGAPLLPDATSRSAAPALAMSAGDDAAAAPATDSTAVPAMLAGRWSKAGGDCATSLVMFQPRRELRQSGNDVAQALAVDSYQLQDQTTVRIAYAGGATATYSAAAGQLRLVRARVAQIDITAQDPLVLDHCGDDADLGTGQTGIEATTLPSTPTNAFRLAVRVGDDLAATLAIAHSLRAGPPLGEGMAEPPLRWAVAHGRSMLVAKLVAAGANPNAADGDGTTLLAQAVARNDVATVEALLAVGADPHRPNGDGSTPIDLAAAQDNQLLVDILFAAGD